jgi:hypothetical protein
MENINKENFFNEVEKKFPMAYKMFDDWCTKLHAPSNFVKMFVELPYLFQIGVILEFINIHRHENAYSEYYDEWFMNELLEIPGMINSFHCFLQFLDECKNPDHRITNPHVASDDDLPF